MNRDNLSFVKMDVTDLQAILQISKEIILNDYIVFLGKEAVNYYIESQQYEDEIVTNINNCIVMKKGETIIGFSIMLESILHLIMIDKKYQKQGYGTALLGYVEAILFKDYKIIELQSFAANTVANTFYEKHSWRKVGELNMNGLLLNKYEKSK